MRNLLNKFYNSLWMHSTKIAGALLLAYLILLLFNPVGLQPTTSLWSLFWLELVPLCLVVLMGYIVMGQRKQIAIYWNKRKGKQKDSKIENILSIWDIPRGMFIKMIAACMGLMWSLGWVLYTCALWSDINNNTNSAEILGYAALASLDLFMVDINGNIIDNINGGYHDPDLIGCPGLLKGAIVLVAILSSLCTFIILINLFFTRFATFLHSKTIKVTPKSNNHIYIFKGTGEKAQQLAKSIAEEDPRHLIVFIESADNRETDEIDGWDKVVSLLTLKNPLVAKRNQNNHGIFLVSEGSLSDFDPEEIQKLTPEEFWSRLGLKRIYTLLNDLNNNRPQKLDPEDEESGNQVHFFFLSDDRDRNISEANAIAQIISPDKDKDENTETTDQETAENRQTKVKKTIYDNIKATIYASARKDSVISIIEETDIKNLSVNIVDDSRLSVDLLKRNEKSNPVRFVNLDLKDNPGTVTSSFNALILGFGETGRDVLRYLYEFSAFVAPYSDEKEEAPNERNADASTEAKNKKKRSKVKIKIIDRDAEGVSGKFMSDRPGLNTSENIKSNQNEPLIEFLPLNIRSQEYYDYVKKAVTELNYIVVSLGDDELNITIASQLLKYARQYRTSLEKFKIFVRVYNSKSFSHIDSVIKHYNKKIKEELKINSILESFGLVEEVYTYGSIIRDKFKVDGENYKKSYDAYSDKVYEIETKNREEQGIPSPATRAFTKWEKMDKERINKFQDWQNALHAPTKRYIIESFLRSEWGFDNTNSIWKVLLHHFDVRPQGMEDRRILTPNMVKYKDSEKISDKFDLLLTNLAITEHLRWNASHEILGFVYGEEKNYRTQTHNCLLPWEKLPTISEISSIRVYDYLVVENTILLKKIEMEQEERRR